MEQKLCKANWFLPLFSMQCQDETNFVQLMTAPLKLYSNLIFSCRSMHYCAFLDVGMGSVTDTDS